jgi:hypothetical protein
LQGQWTERVVEPLISFSKYRIYDIVVEHPLYIGRGVPEDERQLREKVKNACGFDTDINPALKALYTFICTEESAILRQREKQRKEDEYNAPAARIRRQLPSCTPTELKEMLADIPHLLLCQMAEELECLPVPEIEDAE